MEVKLLVPDYSQEKGIVYNWEEGFEVEIKIVDNVVTLIANKQGLVSLANHLLNLAQDSIPSGYHMHFDEYNSLEEGSVGLVVQKQ